MDNTNLETIHAETLSQVTGGFSFGDLFSGIMPGGGQMKSAGEPNLFRSDGGPQSARGNGFLGSIFGNAGQG